MKRADGIPTYWECMLGDKSSLNGLGKVVLFPFMLLLWCFIFVMDTLFSRADKKLLP